MNQKRYNLKNSEHQKRLWSNPEYKKHMSDIHKGRPSSLKGKKGHPAWNKGIKGLQPWMNLSGIINNKGSDHPNWKGGEKKYQCTICNKDFTAGKYRKNVKFCSCECLGKGKIGSIPWNKGVKSSPETIEKLKISHKGQKPWNTGKKRPEISGENSTRWKGGYENTLMLNRKRRVMKINALGSHTLSEWETLKMKYRYMCLCCKQCEPEIRLTEDHIVPLTRGGTNDISNIQPLCRSCNSRKNIQTFDYRESFLTI